MTGTRRVEPGGTPGPTRSDASTEPVLESRDGAVLTITLNRPDALNAFDRPMKDALLVSLRDAARDRTVRVIVLTGAGRAFCAGQDLKERTDADAVPLSVELRQRYNPIILAMRRLEKPIVGAINGAAAGAGCSVALACDLLIAAEKASFLQAFGRVGLVPDSGSTWFLPRTIGYHRAAQMTLTSEPVDAATAERWGLVNRVVPDGGLLDEAMALARRLAAGAPLAMALTKRALDRGLVSTLDEALEFEAELQSVAGRSADHREGVSAFVEKRPATFTGE